MLLRHHGASTLGIYLRRPIAARMSAFSGPLELAGDAMRSIYTLLGKRPSPVSRPVQQPSSRIWQPENGIVFGTSPLNGQVSSRRISGRIDRDDPISGSQADVDFILASSGGRKPSSSNPTAPPSSGSSSGQSDNGDEGWVPPSDDEAASILENELKLKSGDDIENKLHDGTEEAFSEGKVSQKIEIIMEDGADQEPFHTTLKFQMSQEDFEKAKSAGPNTPESFWSHKLYKGPDGKHPPVHYCKQKHTTERVLNNYFQDKKILGFDIEWQPDANKYSGIRRNVSLIQLACEDRIALFHVALFPTKDKECADDFMTPTLKAIMENPDVIKAGVSIKADTTRLRNHLGLESRGLMELSHLYKLVKFSASGEHHYVNKRLVSLMTQTEEHLGLPLYKGDSVRGSDWSQPLSLDQISYAASDAYVGFILYHVLEAKRKALNPTPPRPYFAELGLPIRLVSGEEISTADEATEEPETKYHSVARIRPASKTMSAEASNEDIRIEDDAEPSNTTKSDPKSRIKPQSLIEAEAWAVTYRSTRPITTATSKKSVPIATHSNLRAYALWHHNPTLSIHEIAAILRDMPLKESTVRSYILEAIRIEKLPFEKDRLREVLEEAAGPRGNIEYRYKGLWKMVE